MVFIGPGHPLLHVFRHHRALPQHAASSVDAAANITAFNSSSSPLTLKIMLTVVIIFVPIVLAYQVWAYNLFKGKVTEEDLASEEAY